MRRVFLLLLLLISPSFAMASPALTPIPPGEDKIEPITQGQVSPFSGQVFDNKTALRWGNYLQQCKVRLELDPELVRKQLQAEIEGLEKRGQLQQWANQQILDSYKFRLQELEKEAASPPFYRTPWFGFTLGVVSAVAVAGTTALLVSSLSK